MNVRRLDSWIHESFRLSPEGLALYRIFFGIYTLVIIAPGHDLYASLRSLSALPATMFVPPPGLMMLFDGFPGAGAVELLHLGINVSLVALTFGFHTRVASAASGLLLLLLYGFSYSLGKINHNLLFVMLPLLMSFSNWGAAFSYDARFLSRARAVQTWPITMLALLVGFAMFTAGFAKIIGGWLNPETQAAYGHLVKHFVVRGRTDLLAPILVDLKQPLLWEAFDYATVLFETGFFLAVVRARWTRTFAAMAVLFHFGVMLTLNIAFAFNLVVYAAFADWDRFVRPVKKLRATLPGRWSVHRPYAAIPLLFASGMLFYWIGSPFLWFDNVVPLDSDLSLREVVTVSCAALLVVTVGVKMCLSIAYAWLSAISGPGPRIPHS